MNTATILSTYCKERIHSIGTILQKPKHAISGEDIHSLRVEIKKLRAAAQLVQCCSPAFSKKQFLKPYNKIFKEAGAVRELQIELRLLKKLKEADCLKHFTKQLHKQVGQAKHHFAALLDATLWHHMNTAFKDILPYVGAVEDDAVKNFLQTRSHEMDELTDHGHLKKKEAHALRRQLKVFYYVLLMFEPKDNRFKNIDAFQELLGQWHDDVVTAAYLQKAVDSNDLQGAEKRHVQAAKEQVAAAGKRLFHTINDQLAYFRQARQEVF